MKLVFLYIVLLMWIIFEAIPYEGMALSMFPLSDYQLPFKTWLYFLIEHLGIIMLCYVIASEEVKYYRACQVFFWLQVFDLIDYLLTYNTPWFNLFGLPITFNIISFILFTVVCMKEYERESM